MNRKIEAKFKSVCKKCGKEIKKSDCCYYSPSRKQVICLDCGDNHEKEIRFHDLDEKLGGY